MTIRKHIPNAITILNMVCGLFGIMFALYSRLDWAFYAMIAAAIFDFCDGLVARALNVVSPMGVELDSLSDLISFAMLPAVMLHCLMKECSFSETWLIFVPFLLVLSGGLRLAKFNVDPEQKDGFLGLPTPIAALFSAALCYYICYTPISFLAPLVSGNVFIPILVFVLSALELCRVPMFSFKFHKNDSKTLKNKRMAMILIVLIAGIICVLKGYNWSFVAIVSLLCYILKNCIYAILKV